MYQNVCQNHLSTYIGTDCIVLATIDSIIHGLETLYLNTYVTMESRLFQYSIPHFSFDNAKFHSMGNEDHSMGNEDLFDGERGSIRWGTRWYAFTALPE